MRPLRRLGWLTLALVLLAPSGCKRDTRTKVGFVSNNSESFWRIVEKGAQQQADKEGFELVFRRPPTGSAAEQKEIIDTMLAQGVKAISISVKDPDNQVDMLDRVAARVPLLAVDNDAEKSKRRCYIGTNNVKAGRAVGKLVREAMPEGGVVSLFVGQLEPINARERVQGVLEELQIDKATLKSADGKYRLDQKEAHTDNVSRKVCTEKAMTVISNHKDEPNLCLVGLWAYNPPCLLSAVKQREKLGKVKIVGFDEDPDTLRGIEEGHVYATVVQNPFEFGRRSVEVMAALVRGQDPKPPLPANGKIDVDERIVTRTGGNGRLKASEFRPEIEKLMGE
jgi:ribose transport system substrate-binding protein